MKKGVTVLYNKFGIGCVDIEMGGETYILIREEDLIGTFPGSGATANDIPKLTPLGDRVMLKTDTVSTTTAGGIMLTDGAVEKPCTGVIVSVGGQIPNTLALEMGEAAINIAGTTPTMIDTAEDRNKFSDMCDRVGISGTHNACTAPCACTQCTQ